MLQLDLSKPSPGTHRFDETGGEFDLELDDMSPMPSPSYSHYVLPSLHHDAALSTQSTLTVPESHGLQWSGFSDVSLTTDAKCRKQNIGLEFWKHFYSEGNMYFILQGESDSIITKSEGRLIVANQRHVAVEAIATDDPALQHIVGYSARDVQQFVVALFDRRMEALEEKSETPRDIEALYGDSMLQPETDELLTELGVSIDYHPRVDELKEDDEIKYELETIFSGKRVGHVVEFECREEEDDFFEFDECSVFSPFSPSCEFRTFGVCDGEFSCDLGDSAFGSPSPTVLTRDSRRVSRDDLTDIDNCVEQKMAGSSESKVDDGTDEATKTKHFTLDSLAEGIEEMADACMLLPTCGKKHSPTLKPLTVGRPMLVSSMSISAKASQLPAEISAMSSAMSTPMPTPLLLADESSADSCKTDTLKSAMSAPILKQQSFPTICSYSKEKVRGSRSAIVSRRSSRKLKHRMQASAPVCSSTSRARICFYQPKTETSCLEVAKKSVDLKDAAKVGAKNGLTTVEGRLSSKGFRLLASVLRMPAAFS